jgi:hypothetical protein
VSTTPLRRLIICARPAHVFKTRERIGVEQDGARQPDSRRH